MRHLLSAKVATFALIVVLALLPAAPARAGEEAGASFFAELAGFFEVWLASWLAPGEDPALGYSFPPSGLLESAGQGIGYSYPPSGSPDSPALGGSYPPGGEPVINSELGGSYPPNGSPGDAPTIGMGHPPGGSSFDDEPPAENDFTGTFPPNG